MTREVGWMRTMGILQKHWRRSALFAGVVMLTVIGINVFTRPVYEATARVEIDPSGEKFSLENNGGGSIDAEYLETQSQVMQADSLAIAVIRKLRLDQNPALMGKIDAETTETANLKSSDTQQLTPEESIALGRFKGGLKVKRDTASRLILVSFTSPDPQLAAQVVQHPGPVFYRSEFSEQARRRHEVFRVALAPARRYPQKNGGFKSSANPVSAIDRRG